MSSQHTAHSRTTIRTASVAFVAVVLAVATSACGQVDGPPFDVRTPPSSSVSSGRPSSLPTATPVPNDSAATNLRAGATVLIVGDSFTEGYGASGPATSWGSVAARSLGWKATIDGVGGTGFTKAEATDGRVGMDFPARVSAHAARGEAYDAVVLQGGLNDGLAPPATEAANVRTSVERAHAAWPHADIVVFGPIAPPASTAYLVNLAAIREAAIDAGAMYIDPEKPTPWINAGNTATFDLGDGLHLNDAGYAYLAGRFIAEIEDVRG